MIAIAIAYTTSVIEAFLKGLSYVMVLRRMSCILCDESFFTNKYVRKKNPKDVNKV